MVGMNPIDTLFQRLRREGRKAFMPFLTAGDPDPATTARLVPELAAAGADLIELGFPFSDPIADGPVVQGRGLKLDQVFECARAASAHLSGTPLVGMVSYSLIHRRGPERFIEQAQAAGFSGAIVPDLPAEEAHSLAQLAAARDFKLVLLVTPTTTPERAARIAQLATGFLYCVSIAGITGERDRVPQALLDQLRWLRTQTDLPLCVGFGISTPEHVRTLRKVADGVIVGSALVRRLEQGGDVPALVRELATALN
jgi:tryptophan synthase alpha chain